MARIGILTFHRSINYGAFMQSLALSREISRRHPESSVEIIDYSSAKMERNYRVKLDKYCIKHPTLFFERLKRKKVFRRSLSYLPLSEKTIISDECTGVFEFIKDNYDIVIVGSDAVWNWIKRGFPNPYIMDFDLPIVRMSYAASAFGMGPEHVTPERAEIFGRALSGYRFITVRDDYTSELVKSCAPDVIPALSAIRLHFSTSITSFRSSVTRVRAIRRISTKNIAFPAISALSVPWVQAGR